MSKIATVWVLGSGFSRPLGGPLFSDLFTEVSQRFRKFAFEKTHPAACDKHTVAALKLYRAPNEYCNWIDPEDFLSRLDNAVEHGPQSASYTVLSRILSEGLREPFDNLESVAVAARRVLAAECSAFLIDNPTTLEHWIPYRNWAKTLNSKDTILTFNYDQVLERIKTNLKIVLPGQDGIAPVAAVLKLHGSTSWRCDGSKIVESGDEFFALNCNANEMVIASPGPRKTKLVQSLETLWNIAESKLETCKRVVFLGYRFPPSDAESKHRLLSALRKNNFEPDAHIVLGLRNDDSTRLMQLLKFSNPIFDLSTYLRDIHLWAQDYLEVYNE